jgi:hypothetical protein
MNFRMGFGNLRPFLQFAVIPFVPVEACVISGHLQVETAVL